MKGEAGWPARLEVSEHWDFNIQLFLKNKKQNITKKNRIKLGSLCLELSV